MSTSLSRQLNKLRTSHVLSDPEKSASSGKALLQQQQELTDAQLLLAAKDAFSRIPDCPMHLAHAIFPLNNDLVSENHESLQDLLVALAPSLLLPQTQVLLQFLVTTHKVHVVMPEMLLFVVLPQMQFKICNRVVDVIANHYPRPPWVAPFLSLCHPATERGLIRHLSTDRGFFRLITDLLHRAMTSHHRLMKHREEELSMDNLCFFYTDMMCKVIVNSHTINEAHSFSLVSVITAGLKSSNHEFVAMAGIILAHLLPKANFRPKANRRLLKLLEQSDANNMRSETTLKLALVLARHQRMENELRYRIATFVMSKKDALRVLVTAEISRVSNDYKTRLVETLVLLMDENYEDLDLNKDRDKVRLETQTELIENIFRAMNSSEMVKPINALAKVIKATSTLVNWLTKQNRDGDDEKMIDEDSMVNSAAGSARRLMSLLRERFPLESAMYTSSVNEQMEHFIMEEDGKGNALSSEQIRVKRIILDNKFIAALANLDMHSVKDRSVVKEMNKMAKMNAAEIREVFEDVDNDFLVHHLDKRLLEIVMHSLNFYNKSPKILVPIIKLAGSEQFHALLKENEEEATLKATLELTLLSLVIGSSASWPKVLSALKSSWLIQHNEESLLSKIVLAVEDEENYVNCAWQAITKIIKINDITEMTEIMLANPICLQNPTLATIMLLLCSKSLGTKTVKNELKCEILSKILRIIENIKDLNVSGETSGSDDALNLLTRSRQRRSVPLAVLENALESSQKVNLTETNVRALLKTIGSIRKTSSDHIQVLADKCESLFLAQTEKQVELLFDLLQDDDDDIILIALKQLSQSGSNETKLDTNSMLKIVVCVSRKKRKVRKEALKIIESNASNKKNELYPLLVHLVKSREVLIADKNNVEAVMKTFNKKEVLNHVLQVCVEDKTLFVKANFLFKHFDFEEQEVLEILAKLFVDASKEEDEALLECMASNFLDLITANMDNTKMFELVEELVLNCDNEKVKLATLSALSKSNLSWSLFNLLVDSVASASSGDLVLAAKNAVLALKPTDTMVMDKLAKVWGKETFAASEWEKSRVHGSGFKRRYGKIVDTDENLDVKWKQTVFLLETMSILLSSPLLSMSSLLKPLFILLKKALAANELSDFTYVMQLLLSVLQQILEHEKKQHDDLGLTQVTDLLVQCMKDCSAPVTKNSALMVLALATSTCRPQNEVMHNMLPIFTFVGNHFLQMDTKNSFDIACRAIDILIPTLKKCDKLSNSGDVREKCLSILTTFCDCSHDLNALRFRSFLHKLVVALGEFDYFWVTTLKLLNRKYNDEDESRMRRERLHQLLNLYTCFSAKAQVESLLQMSVNLKIDSNNLRRTVGLDLVAKEDEEVIRSDFGLLKLEMLEFVCFLLKSNFFNEKVISSTEDIRPQLTLLLEAAIVNVASIPELDNNEDKAAVKVLRAIKYKSEHFLESVLASAIPSEYFPEAVAKLLSDNSNSQEAIRRKTLEVIILRLNKGAHYEDIEQIFTESNVENFIKAIAPLATSTGFTPTKQLALLALRALVHTCIRFGAMSSSLQSTLVRVLKLLSEHSQMKPLMETSAFDKRLKASYLICFSELFHVLGAKAVAQLAPFVKLLLAIMKEDNLKEHTVLMNSVILSVQRVTERFAGFLHPFLPDLIVLCCRLQSNNKISENRLRHMFKALAKGVPQHFMLNLAPKCFQRLKTNKEALIIFFRLLRDNVSLLSKTQAGTIAGVYVDFFAEALQMRQNEENDNENNENSSTTVTINDVESAVIDAFLALGLKLALDEFKPLFYKLFLIREESLAANTTAFHLALVASSRLKSLFGFVFESLVPKATSILAEMKRDAEDERAASTLIDFVLDTLREVFKYADIEQIMGNKFEEQVNNVLTVYDIEFNNANLRNNLFKKLELCLVQLAKSTEDDTQWKYLNYQTLLCLRSDASQVKLAVLDVLQGFVAAKGDEYMSVLGDAAPVLNEVMDDHDEAVEKRAKALVDSMQDTFGQSVQSYFEQ